MAVYNAEATIELATRSILDQTYRDIECLIIDDGSTDATPDILRQLERQDTRCRVHRQTNAGQTVALNRALDWAKGRYIARMDADDVSASNRFEIQADYLRSFADTVAVGSLRNVIDGDGKIIKRQKPRWPRHANLKAIPPRYVGLVHPSAMVRADLFKSLQYRPFFRYAQDVDLWLRLATRGRLHVINQRLLDYREAESAVSSKHKVDQELFALIAILSAVARAKGLDDPVDVLERPTLPGVLDHIGSRHDTLGLRLWVGHRLVRRLPKAGIPTEIRYLIDQTCLDAKQAPLWHPRTHVLAHMLRSAYAVRETQMKAEDEDCD